MWLYIHIGYSQLLKHRCLKLGEKSSCREAPRGIGRLGNPRGTHGSQRGAIYVRSRWCEAEKGSVGVFFGFVTKLGYPKFYWCIIMFPIMILEVYPIPFGVQFLRYNLFLSDTAHMFFHLVWVCKDIKNDIQFHPQSQDADLPYWSISSHWSCIYAFCLMSTPTETVQWLCKHIHSLKHCKTNSSQRIS